MKKQTKVKPSRLNLWWQTLQYKHTTTAIVILVLFVIFLDSVLIQALLSTITNLGYTGIFLIGVLFVSFFTAGPAVALLVAVAGDYNPYAIALVAGLGTIVGDWIILRLLEDRIGYELKPLAKKFGFMPILRLMRRKVFRPVAVFIGAICIGSPLTDEVGLALLGLTKIGLFRLLLLTFSLNTIGIFIIVYGTQVLT